MTIVYLKRSLRGNLTSRALPISRLTSHPIWRNGIVHVSTIAFKPGYLKIVEEITKLICEKQVFYEYRVIKNANITREHIWRDKIHLNESGLSLLANNFIQAINRKHTA